MKLKNIEVKYKVLVFFIVIAITFIVSNIYIGYRISDIDEKQNLEVSKLDKMIQNSKRQNNSLLLEIRNFSKVQLTTISNLKLYLYISTPIIIIILGSILYFVFVIPLRDSFRTALRAMDKMSKGDMNEPIHIEVMDEVGKVLQSIRIVRVILQGIFCEISSVSNMISDSAKEMRDYADTFISTSEQLTTSAVEASMSVEELANLAQEIANANLEEGDYIKQVYGGIEKSNLAFQSIEKSILELNSIASTSASKASRSSDSAKLALTAMQEIDKNSSNIQSMLSLIKDISKQINLLALNASIEAARAGEAGMGFSVVADEVSNLATKTDSTVREVEKNIILTRSAVKNGVSKVKETEVSIRTIIDDSQKINSKVQSITNMINEQNKEINELQSYSNQMVNIAQVIESTSLMQKDIAIEIKNLVQGVEKELTSITSGSNIILKLAEDKIRIAKFLQTIMDGFQIDNSILIKWDDALKVNIQKIDEQHEKLVSMINQLYNAIQLKNPSKETISSVLKSLVDYVKVHFKTEEDYFKQFNYPYYETHKLEHDAFAGQILSFQKDFDAGVQTIGFELLDFLKDWLVKHILISDKKYSKFLNDKKVF